MDKAGLYPIARDLVNQGLPGNEVRWRLLEQGFAEREVDVILRHLAASGPSAPATEMQGPGQLAAVCRSGLLIGGGSLAALGTALFMGNVTGIMLTFPMAGFLLMGLGGWLTAKGCRL